MAQHDMVIDNQSGLNFRTDLNNALAALVSSSSGNSEPSTTYAYQYWIDTSGAFGVLKIRNAANSGWIVVGRVDREALGLNYFFSGNSAPSATQAFMPWVDTSGANPILKVRNAADSAWITIGRVDVDNFALLPLTGGTLTGAVIFSNTDHVTLPRGTTAQRPGSPADGMLRFNTSLNIFEGYRNTAWGEIGGGGFAVFTTQSITGSGDITANTTDALQFRPIQGNAGAVSASTTPFGTSGGWKDGTRVTLMGIDDANSVTLTYNDAAKGLVGNFTTIELTRFKAIDCIYNSALDRWIVVGGI